MKRLEENKLIYGRLLTVSDPHLVGRYNEAMVGLGNRETKLKRFRIDMMGYSPEVADELGDENYLDPHDINRRFIILSPAQANLPVIQTGFSNTEWLMSQFFERNARSILALTVKDAVYGEIEDSVFKADDIEDLLSIEDVEFKVSTPQDILGQAKELRVLSDRLLKEPNAWNDDRLLSRMVELSKACGDIRKNDLVPDELVFRHNTFWTRHFGGLYIFIDEDQTTVIGNPDAPGFRRSRPWQVSYLDIDDAEAVYDFLLDTGRIDPPLGSWIERSNLIAHRAEMLIAWLSAKNYPESPVRADDRRWLNSFIRKNGTMLEDEGTLPFLNWAKHELSNWSRIEVDEIDPYALFLVSRGRPEHRDQYLVNRLISEYVSFDFMTRFVVNKPAFYRDYQSWPEPYREYVVERITNNYLKDKVGFRSRLFNA